MRQYNIINLFVVAILLFSVAGCTNNNKKADEKTSTTATTDPLTSWNKSTNKTDIINFVNAVTDEKSKDFVPVSDRVAVFDNDGTIWSEQPLYFQFFFAFDRVRELAVDSIHWKNTQPYKAVLENDMATIGTFGMKDLGTLLNATHTGMTSDEFYKIVKNWIQTARHPQKKQLYTDFIYKPMLELIAYLQANDFKTYIVSGGSVGFMRPIIPEIYGIPAEQIIGTTFNTEFDFSGDKPVINRVAGVKFVDDKEGKPVNIQQVIGKKPIFCAGNSDGDLAMMQWTASNNYKSMMLYVHHTDADREWAYDRESKMGRFDKALDEAMGKNWTLVDMKDDWKTIFITGDK